MGFGGQPREISIACVVHGISDASQINYLLRYNLWLDLRCLPNKSCFFLEAMLCCPLMKGLYFQISLKYMHMYMYVNMYMCIICAICVYMYIFN